MSSMLAKARAALKPTPPSGKKSTAPKVKTGHINVVPTNYTSLPVSIPKDFLITPPETAPTSTPIDFASTTLPEYSGKYAIVLDNVLSPSECATFLSLVESSSSTGWAPAMINAGSGYEFIQTDYRNSDRIVWDQQELIGRIWERCKLVEGLEEELKEIKGEKAVKRGTLVPRRAKEGQFWTFKQPNARMRNLKYGPGQFFKEHCDGAYETPDGKERSFYTLHLYLNDSVQELEKLGLDTSHTELKGGATTFWSDDLSLSRRLDVDPKAGRVLIFQHQKLLHSGDVVEAGVKYTMRTDLMYEMRFEDEENKK